MSVDARLAICHGSSILSVLSEPALASLAAQGQIRRYGRGSILFMPGDQAPELFVIASGAITIQLTSSDGREMIIDELGRGDIFGELALLTRQPHAIMAVTHSPCELLALPAESLGSLVAREPALSRALLAHVSGLLAVSIRREEALAFLAAPARIARMLRLLNEELVEQGYITISQEEIARRTGLTRQTVAACLGRWRRLGWLLTGRGRIVLLNLPALAGIEEQALL